MKINLAHIFGATAVVGFGHYGITGLEDAGVSLSVAAQSMVGATALMGIVVAQEKLNAVQSTKRVKDDDIQPPSGPA